MGVIKGGTRGLDIGSCEAFRSRIRRSQCFWDSIALPLGKGVQDVRYRGSSRNQWYLSARPYTNE